MCFFGFGFFFLVFSFFRTCCYTKAQRKAVLSIPSVEKLLYWLLPVSGVNGSIVVVVVVVVVVVLQCCVVSTYCHDITVCVLREGLCMINSQVGQSRKGKQKKNNKEKTCVTKTAPRVCQNRGENDTCIVRLNTWSCGVRPFWQFFQFSSFT